MKVKIKFTVWVWLAGNQQELKATEQLIPFSFSCRPAATGQWTKWISVYIYIYIYSKQLQ